MFADFGSRWDERRNILTCDRTERTDMPAHGTLIAFNGGFKGWVSPAHWHADIEPKTGRLRAMFWHEVA